MSGVMVARPRKAVEHCSLSPGDRIVVQRDALAVPPGGSRGGRAYTRRRMVGRALLPVLAHPAAAFHHVRHASAIDPEPGERARTTRRHAIPLPLSSKSRTCAQNLCRAGLSDSLPAEFASEKVITLVAWFPRRRHSADTRRGWSCSSPRRRQTAEGHRPARRLHRHDTMLPIVADFAGEMIDRARRHRHRHPLETGTGPTAKSHRGFAAQRYADDVFEHGSVLVPPYSGPWIVANEQCLDEITGCQPGEAGGPCLQRLQPIRNRVGGREHARLEIIAPALAVGEPLARPLLEAERAQLGMVDRGDQRLLIERRDERLRISEPGRQRCAEQIGLAAPCDRLEHAHGAAIRAPAQAGARRSWFLR